MYNIRPEAGLKTYMSEAVPKTEVLEQPQCSKIILSRLCMAIMTKPVF
jgi:hypothetical protein